MTGNYEMRFAGSGGQGVILLSVIIAEAAVIDGKNAAQTQSYGPEARGGVCKAETIISDHEIKFTKVRDPDFLLALNQDSLDKYSGGLKSDALIMADESLTVPEGIDPGRVERINLTGTAREVTGKAVTANIVAAGAINSRLKLVSDRALEQAVRRNIPRGTEELNLRALEAGKNLI